MRQGTAMEIRGGGGSLLVSHFLSCFSPLTPNRLIPTTSTSLWHQTTLKTSEAETGEKLPVVANNESKLELRQRAAQSGLCGLSLKKK